MQIGSKPRKKKNMTIPITRKKKRGKLEEKGNVEMKIYIKEVS